MANKPTVASSAASFGSELKEHFPHASPEREAFVFNSILRFVTKSQVEKSMKPITVTGKDGVKITIKVMPDYVMIGSTRVPMSGNTASRVASHFGLKVPNAKTEELVYQNADVQVAAKPLSGQGAVVDGKKYTGQEVVNKGVDYSGFVVEYNKNINQELSSRNVKPGQIVSGFGKSIVEGTGDERNLGLYGMHDAKGKPIGAATPTGGTSHDREIHSEYGAFLRLVSDEVEVTDPKTGKVTKVPADQIDNLISGTPVTSTPPSNQQKPVAKSYGPSVKGTPTSPAATPARTAPSSKDEGVEPIKDFLESLSQRRNNIVKRSFILKSLL